MDCKSNTTPKQEYVPAHLVIIQFEPTSFIMASVDQGEWDPLNV